MVIFCWFFSAFCVFLCVFVYFRTVGVAPSFVFLATSEQHPHWRYAIYSNQRHYPRNFKKSSLWIFPLRVIMTVFDSRCIAIASNSADNHSTCDKFGDGLKKPTLHIKRRLLIHSPSTHWRWCYYNTRHQERQERHIRPLLIAR